MKIISINFITIGALSMLFIPPVFAQQVLTNGSVTILKLPNTAARAGGAGIDFAHAKAKPLPTTSITPGAPETSIDDDRTLNQIFGSPRFSPGEAGTGKQSPVQLVPPQQFRQNSPGIPPGGQQKSQSGEPIISQEFGTVNQPYSTSEASAFQDDTVTHYPFRAAGKLFFNIGNDTFVCSASLIKKGLVVTAAHCVSNFGHNQFYSNWVYVPAYNNGAAPFGSWSAGAAFVLTPYLNGKDKCARNAVGVVCLDDVALLALNPQNGAYPGTATGFFGYGFNKFGFTKKNQALITQLGYPVALDDGEIMLRNDSQGFIDKKSINNTLIGSLMTGGSSGGPWVVNFGIPPALTGTSFGQSEVHNVIVGVTSWGFTNPDKKQQGASPFTSLNIDALVTQACTASPAAC